MKTKTISFALVMSFLCVANAMAADWVSRFVEKEKRRHEGYVVSMGPLMIKKFMQKSIADHQGIEGLETASFLDAALTCEGREQRKKIQRLRQKAARHGYDITEEVTAEKLELTMTKKEEGKVCHMVVVVCTQEELHVVTLEGTMPFPENLHEFGLKADIISALVASEGKTHHNN